MLCRVLRALHANESSEQRTQHAKMKYNSNNLVFFFYFIDVSSIFVIYFLLCVSYLCIPSVCCFSFVNGVLLGVKKTYRTKHMNT